jgi:hypothetical protein
MLRMDRIGRTSSELEHEFQLLVLTGRSYERANTSSSGRAGALRRPKVRGQKIAVPIPVSLALSRPSAAEPIR